MDLFIGVDMGTSGCRVIAIDAEGTVHARAELPLPAPEAHGPAVEQDPTLWWETCREALGVVLEGLAPGNVQALAVDGTSGTLLLTDAEGRPLGPALLYNDARAIEESARIVQAAPPDCAAHGPSASLAKLLWLQAHCRATPAHALHQADWLLARLGAPLGVTDENNALKLGFDAARRRWPEWLDGLGVNRELLPRVVPPGTPIGGVGREAQDTLGLGPHTRLVAGTTDSVAAFLAAGAGAPGEAVTSLGSTLVLKIVSPRPVFAPEYGIYSHRLWDTWLAGGASNSGGAVLRKYFTVEEMEALTPKLEPERPTGLDYYPLAAAGERFPVNDPGFAPRVEPREPDPARFFQALLEGIAQIEARGYSLLASLGAPQPASVRTVGGGARNPAWTQIRTRLLGVPVLTAEHEEAAYGAALLARRGASATHPD